MASGRPLSPAYRRRIERALARGKTRQQARGHHAGEHAERVEREREELGVSREEIVRIRRWASRRANAIHDSAFDPDDVIEEARTQGYDWFRSYRDTWNEARQTYLREERRGEYASRGTGHLEYLASIPPIEDLSWMYYH
jgi:hypothetical protein